MDRAWRLALVAAGVAVAVALFFVLRDNGNDNESAASTQRTTATTATAPKPQPQATTIAVRGGQVIGGLKRISTTKDDRVTIVVRADVSDEVHVHGYNLKADVTPAAPARIAFRANLVGRFEIQLESRSFQIAELEVSP